MDNKLIYSLGSFCYILSCIFSAAVRWGHVCSPYAKYSDSFFPARKMSLFFFLFSIVMFPYVVDPMNAEAWILVKFYGILFIPTVWILLLHKFFSPSDYERNKHKLRLMASVPTMIVPLLFILSIVPNSLSKGQEAQINYIGIGTGVVLLIYLVYSTVWLYRRANEYNRDNYSNEEEFPIRFAYYIIWQPLAYTLTGWIVLFSDSRLLKACFDFLLSGWHVILLLASLHPKHINDDDMKKLEEVISKYVQRKSFLPSPDIFAEEDTDSLSRQCIAGIKADILDIVEHRKGFLNPHLTLAIVAAQTDYGRTYVSKVFKQEFGGFYNYVNRLRLDYAERYARDHPEANQEEIACQSGFSSRVSHWRAAERLSENTK